MKERYEIEKNISVPFYLVLPKLHKEARKLGKTIFHVIDAVRAEWIRSLPSKKDVTHEWEVSREELITKCKALKIELPRPNPKLVKLAKIYEITPEAWQYDRNFVLKYRLHLPIGGIHDPLLKPAYDLFFELFGEYYKGKEHEIMKVLERYDLSIRPLNLSLSIATSEAIKNFLPEIDQKFVKDPFGVQRKEHLVLDEIGGKLVYLATRKKEHGTYLAILRTVAYCTAGCAKCYRGEQTRELKHFKAIDKDGREEIVYFLPPVEQVRRLIKYWNEKDPNPPGDILFSGGEPMDVSVDEWVKIIKLLEKAKYLQFFRICTGDLFLGEPFRLTEKKFLEALERFHHNTGKTIKFPCHLPHPKFITPEAIYAILTLQKLGIGIEIQSQTPLEEGIMCFQKEIMEKLKNKKNKTTDELINAWSSALAKSYKLLRELSIKISMLGYRPYKFIHDMQQSVSIIYTTILYSLLSEPHVGDTDAAIRPTSFAIFTPHLPNINVGFHTFQYISHIKDAYKCDGRKVTYKLPHAVGAEATYQEPFWDGVNDIDTIRKLSDITVWQKLRKKVKELAKR